MKNKFTSFLACLLAVTTFGQITYELEIVAEGNFGSPTGDVFVRNTTVSPATNSGGRYQEANSTTGFDVLQDYKITGSKAIFIEKPAGTGRIVITDHPSFTELHTFTTSNAPQSIGVVSNTKAYVSYGNPGDLVLVDLVNYTLTPVTDPSDYVSSYSNHMVYAAGHVYAAIGSNLIKVDTLTNTAVEQIATGLQGIKGLVVNDDESTLWVMDNTDLVSIDLQNGGTISAPVTVGTSSSSNVRYYDENIYYWSGTSLYIYNIAAPELPLTSVYTSSLPGNAWSFGYGKSFAIDPATGDFVIATANNYTAPGYFEVVNGTDFSIIESDNMPGCAIPNNCVLKTYHTPTAPPTPTVDPLPLITAECSVTLDAPTATGEGGTVTGTTTDPVEYSEQGTYTVTWTYTDENGTSTQTQTVEINDVTNPVPSVQPISVSCNETVAAPEAVDNCAGTISGTTTDPVSYTEAGVYTITWSFDDGNGNTVTQDQEVTVNCLAALPEQEELSITAYPNPTRSVVYISTNQSHVSVQLVDALGKVVSNAGLIYNGKKQLDLSHLESGVYFISLSSPTETRVIRMIKE